MKVNVGANQCICLFDTHGQSMHVTLVNDSQQTVWIAEQQITVQGSVDLLSGIPNTATALIPGASLVFNGIVGTLFALANGPGAFVGVLKFAKR